MPAKRDRRQRRRPERPYNAGLSFRKAIFRFLDYVRLRGMPLHGARCQRVLLGLAERHPKVRSGIIYTSTEQLGALGHQSDRSVQRAVPELEEYGVIEVARPNQCDGTCRWGKVRGGRCPGHGGKIFLEDGRAVGAASGYSLRKDWLDELAQARRGSRRSPEETDHESAPPPASEDRTERLARIRREAEEAHQRTRAGPAP